MATNLMKTKTCKCGGEMLFSDYCGAFICEQCDNHYGLARCYCGWSLSGNNGYQELIDMGEQIEEDY